MKQKPFRYCPECRSKLLPQRTIQFDGRTLTSSKLIKNNCDPVRCPDCGHYALYENWQHETEAPTPAQLKRRQITLNLNLGE